MTVTTGGLIFLHNRKHSQIIIQILFFSINAAKDSYGHGRKFINVLDILNNNFIKYNDIIGSVSVSEKVEETNKVEYGDLLFLRSSETREDVGKSSVYLDEDEFALFGGFVIRGKKQPDFHPYFLKLNLESPKVRDQISSKAGGSTRFADFISHFDKKIQLQHEKIDLLKEQKKGYMQKIFSQELQFKDNNDQFFINWKEVELGNITVTFSGGTPSVSNRDYYNGNIPFIRSGEIHTNKTELYIYETAINKSSAKMVEKGDILYALYGATSGEVAISQIAGAINQAILCIRTNENKFFIKYWLENMKENILNVYLQGGQGNLSASIIKSLKINLPHIDEQAIIANFFVIFDKKIQIEEIKLNSLIQQKQAYMQQMFI
ncbi:restriction endonuclease subunit S [Lysinibacillus fusiformis]|uniref:restriction endonuclease subunit S n=1 Tax=Lysinibacillus fusiformis TaxID=28031 RepID=UPI003556681D